MFLADHAEKITDLRRKNINPSDYLRDQQFFCVNLRETELQTYYNLKNLGPGSPEFDNFTV
jgi:hypothetical protein